MPPRSDRRAAHERTDPRERPQRRSRYDDYEPLEPHVPIGNGSHHPISRVRYRGADESDDRTEYRTRRRVGFRTREKGANFSSLKVRGYAFFLGGAVFEGPWDFASANIASTFAAPGAKFQSKEKQANFGGMKVGGYAFFNDAVFEGPVNFGLAEIATALSANRAKFQNKETEANFGSMKVGGYAFFDDAVFEGPVTFVLAEIAGAFHATGQSLRTRKRKPTSTA